jgi:hypothetical protein
MLQFKAGTTVWDVLEEHIVEDAREQDDDDHVEYDATVVSALLLLMVL